MIPVMSIVVATENRGKLAEMRSLLSGMPVEVLAISEALDEAPSSMQLATTFEDNALRRARMVATDSMMVTLADASGLEVDALGGRPGVRSARFAGEGATDAENNAELLKQMNDVEDELRTARFRCAIALVDPWDPEGETVLTGCCEGRVAHQPTGAGGFGYDPLFIVDGLNRTLAELGEDERQEFSHRGRALKALKPKLSQLVTVRLEETMRILTGEPPSR